MGKLFRLSFCMAAFLIGIQAKAQKSTDFMQAFEMPDCTINFDIHDEGQEFRVNWGMDTAWDSEANVTRGVNYIGKENFSTGRLSFQPTYLVIDNGDGTYELTDIQKRFLRSRIRHLQLTGVKQANINCDNAAASDKLTDGTTGLQNYTRKVENWYKLIKATVKYCRENGMEIISISPYNEPDLDENKYWWKSDFHAICELIRNDPYFDGIRVCGGNTLNTDRAWDWYVDLRDVIDEGNTHQLAGSFKNYADFFTKVKAEGKLTANDELHNVGEAIIGVNYGMQTGIWWGFDSRARGQFCHDSQEGVRIAYGEDRSHWTGGAVYRNEKTGEIHAFMGSSERQANNSKYNFVSTAQDVYYNGYGPTRLWHYQLRGGTGYQQGQINAEMCVDITCGEDVAPAVINGTYCIMNRASKKVITMNGTSEIQSTDLRKSNTNQQWVVTPQKLNGDCSFHTIDNAGNTAYTLDLKNWNLRSGATIITWKGDHNDLEQWYLKYAKEGYYYIVNRYSNKYLYCSSNNSGTMLQVVDPPAGDVAETVLNRYLWRFQPVDADCETVAPGKPTTLSILRRPGSMYLEWTPPADDDVATYNILRSDNGVWNTIGRNDSLCSFVDNTALPGHEYVYKVVAVDKAGNRSEPSNPSPSLTLLSEPGLICQLQFDKSTADSTDNHLDASLSEDKYSTILKKSGTGSLNLTGTKEFVLLPYSVAHHPAMTVAFWIRMTTATKNGHIFDFGTSEDNCMYMHFNSKSELEFIMRHDGEEQILGTGSKFTATSFKHVALTFEPTEEGAFRAKIFVEGEEVAVKDDFTISPADINAVVCYLGRSFTPAHPLLKAYLDDLRIYNYALSAEEIQSVMEDLDGMAFDYKDIADYTYTTIETVSDDTVPSGKADAVYSVAGQRSDMLRKGINLIVSKEGTVKKVLVK